MVRFRELYKAEKEPVLVAAVTSTTSYMRLLRQSPALYLLC